MIPHNTSDVHGIRGCAFAMVRKLRLKNWTFTSFWYCWMEFLNRKSAQTYAGHNQVKRSCIFCFKIWPASIPYSFFAGLIPGDDPRFAIFVGFIKLYSRLDYLYLYYSVYIQALNWYLFFSDFEMLYLTVIWNYQASLRYQYWSLSPTLSTLAGIVRSRNIDFSRRLPPNYHNKWLLTKKNCKTMSGFFKIRDFF